MSRTHFLKFERFLKNFFVFKLSSFLVHVLLSLLRFQTRYTQMSVLEN